MKVEIWSDVGCPWCYIGKRRFEAALAEFPHADDVEVVWRSFQLDPTLPDHYDGTELEYLATRKGLDPDRVEAMFDHVTRQAAAEGLGYDFSTIVVANSLRAHQLIHLAAVHGRADEAEERLFAGHFERGEDIGSVDHLVSLAVDLGIDEAEAREALASERFAAAVHADIDEARRLGIRGVPFFVVDRAYGISGAQPTDVFAEALAEAWAASHPLQMVTGDTGADADACGPDGCPI